MLKQVRNNNNIIKEYEYTSNKLTKLINNGSILNIEYDSIGNITKLGQVNLTYNSRNLLKEYYKDNTHNYTFEYDYRGRRIKKIKNNSYVTKYYYDEETLVGEANIDTNTNNIIRAYIYYYDALGICGIKSITKDENNDIIEKNYHFIKNSLGDITKLMCNGVVVGSYSYDAWGNVEIIEESNSDSIDIDTLYNNPFRYRGYYYDVETGWFWLSSRYYSPELCRFISPDDVEYLDPESLNGLNLYCYCLNNPIMYADPSGHSAILIGLIIGAIVGATIGFGTAAYIDYQDDGQIFNGSVAWYDYVGATVLGGAAGAAIGAGIGAFAGMSFFATLPTGFAMVQTTAGTTVLVATGSMTLTVTGAQILGAAGLLGATYMFAKGGLPNNQYQNKQWTEAMRRLGIKDKDLWQRLHKAVGKHPYNTHDNLKKLMELLEEILKKWGKL